MKFKLTRMKKKKKKKIKQSIPYNQVKNMFNITNSKLPVRKETY